HGDVHREFQHARSYVMDNLNWILPLAIFVGVLIIALTLLLMWLNSRGKFMFLYCVALNRAEVVEPWKRFADLANSLFWFRLVLALVGMVITVPLLVFMALLAIPMFRNDSWNFGGIMILSVLGMTVLSM